MKSEFIPEIIESYDQMNDALRSLNAQVLEDHQLPFWLPAPFEMSRELASRALTAIWYQDFDVPLPPSGILCASQRTLNACEAVNQAKLRFSNSIIALRNSTGANKASIGDVVNGILKNARRCPEVREGMQTAGLSRIKLQAAYKRIQVVKSNLRSISWTLARAHREVTLVTRSDAISRAEKLSNPDTQGIALRLLSGLSPNTQLAQVKYKKNPQLKANITYFENGELKRYPTVTANIVLTADPVLPVLKWFNPVSGERLGRSDIRISKESFIEAMNLHLYETAS